MPNPVIQDLRPDPDALLATVQQAERRAERGKLKIFFGAAPGVGKTYAMLEEGRARAAEGMDVVVGYAEPHARMETEALLLGMELLPHQTVEYKNVRLKEFDLDAALRRHPALLLIDELAHTNAPGMRHPKRWQDVMEALDAGIDIYTTLNVQHLESLNDVVERITGVQVRETLPDSVLEEADEVELVDISPEELLERLGEGKVYTSDVAERATRNFFSRGNLLALRELALRRTAERVDAQMRDFRRANAVRVTWPASDRILVCVGPSPLSARLIRSTRRLASGMRAAWVAAYIQTPAALRLGEADRRRIDQNLRLAEQLGAQVVSLQGQNVADEVIEYAAAHNVTKIVIGKPDRPRWRDLLFGSIVDDLVRRSGEIDIYVIRGARAAAELEAAGLPPAVASHRVRRRNPATGYVAAALGIVLATGIAWPFQHSFGFANTNTLMLYLLAVLWIASRFSRGAAIFAAVLAVASFDFFFVPPYFTFAISDQQYLFTFAVMLVTALTIGTLTNRVRMQADAARGQARRNQTLLDLSRDLAAARTVDAIERATHQHVGGVLDARATLILPDGQQQPSQREPQRLIPRAVASQVGVASAVDDDGSGEPAALDAKELGVAQWAFEHEQPAGRGTGTLPAAAGIYLPMKTSRATVGVLGIFPRGAEAELQPEQRQLVESFASQLAVAVERAALAEEARQAWERVEAEFLRNTLLSGVSHELRTPLAAITGAASTLADAWAILPDEARHELLDTIGSEADRMERLINNLLDMTRLESGGLAVRREWQPLAEIVGSALHHLDRRLVGRGVRTDLPADLPLVCVDGIGIEQVLANLLDNAVEYTSPGTPIMIGAQARDDRIIVRVTDHGPGLPPGTEQRVFQKFFRAQPADAPRGIGLGLAISKGIVEAHGGQITARNDIENGGAIFEFTIPITGTPPTVDGSA
jgi:two-component system sensor histidine kinase KdpD